jgi:heterotetrameric sarcosine oxidase gamma subunit
VAKLIAQTPTNGLLPIRSGGIILSQLWPEHITSITPFRGMQDNVAKQLKKLHKIDYPVGQDVTGTDAISCVWTGQGQVFLIGPEVGKITGAALTDQTDGWAMLRLEGAKVEAVLARLVPLDLRLRTFPEGRAARSLLGHMPLSIARTGVQCFDLMVFRSMASTAIHELEVAMKSVAAQG